MYIQIDKIKKQPRQLEIDEAASGFAVLAQLAKQEGINFTEHIKGGLTAAWVGDVIEVKGHLKTSVEAPCARCLVPVNSRLAVELLLCYSSKAQQAVESEEVELSTEEMELIQYSGLEIDLRPDLGQEIVMALPQQFICAQGCRGLCPECGINLNQKQCSCEKPVFHAGLDALKGFKIKQ